MTLDAPIAIAALDGRTVRVDDLPAMLHIVTDTRTLRPGDTFLALCGERFDGQAFLPQAFAAGAAACIVRDAAALPDDRPGIVVGDTLAAYMTLARLARSRIASRVAAISGSAGKTTTKAFLLQLLRAAGARATATPENENNEIGVSKFFLGLEESDTRIAIVELGARKHRDLDPLVEIAKPEVAILTNIGEAHLEIFGSRERLAETKWGLFASGARAVLNIADAPSRMRASTLSLPPLWFGTGDVAPPHGEPGIIVRDAARMLVHDGTHRSEFPIDAGSVPGEHNRANIAAAVGGAVALGFAPEMLAPHIAALRLPSGRYQAVALAGDMRLIYDAYNANVSGMLATLVAFAHENATRRIAVLGSMAELGSDAPAMHRQVGAAAVLAADVLLAGGDFAREIERGAHDAGMRAADVVTFGENAEAIAWLRANARAGDVLLLKGSRKYRMEEIAVALGAELHA